MAVCCFTGHRDLGGKDAEISKRLHLMVESCIVAGFNEFRVGGALGFDTLAAETVLKLREQYPAARLVVMVPCRDQDRAWSREQKERYHAILQTADEVKVLSETYYRGCMFARNRALVDGSELCLAYLKGAGGTKMTVDYAKKQNVTVINIGDLI